MAPNSPANAIRAATHAAYMMSIAHPGSHYQEMGERMRNPVPGDLVVEISTVYFRTDASDAVGELLREVREPYPDQEPGEDATERVVYIKAFDGAEIRWVNCQFVAVPPEPRSTI